MASPFHAAYWAYRLTQSGAPNSPQRLGAALGGARVQLNPHQVEAALFAIRSPLKQGVLLADEVGLGKTIEAGLVLAQRWAEGRRNLLLIVPATLRKQWQTELAEKFRLPSVLVDGPRLRRDGASTLTQPTGVIIISYPFAAAQEGLLRGISWDLVVIDEAHRLRNVYRESAQQANAIKRAIGERAKVLLTATPLQNSLLELYGLVSIVDEYAFGDLESFREQFMNPVVEVEARNRALRERMAPFFHRRLRRHVLEYVPFKRRVPLLHRFEPSDTEQQLYDGVSRYLERDSLLALPPSQRHLMTLILRKLLASSSVAIARTLGALIERIQNLAAGAGVPLRVSLSRLLAEPASGGNTAEEIGPALDFDTADELLEDWEVEGEVTLTPVQSLMMEELEELQRLRGLALRVAGGDPDDPRLLAGDEKGRELVRALPLAFEEAARRGAQRKAVIFTESRRTQQYLRILLEAASYRVVTINGTNTDPRSQQIYQQWRQENPGKASGVKAADKKAALVDAFAAPDTDILVATESAAEGVNLQFCSLVVNYDLPWNPQRVEQRIGRCHRYGQQHDVLVVNLLNARNAADARVYELLSERLKLFDGLFGSSDEVLGAIGSGINLEKRIAEAYKLIRYPDKIAAAFDQLQQELSEQIQTRLQQTRQDVLDHFDADVAARLNVEREQAREMLDERQRDLHRLARYELRAAADFHPQQPYFDFRGDNIHSAGRYFFDWQQAEANHGYFFAPGDGSLADTLLNQARTRALQIGALRIAVSPELMRHAILAPLITCTGWLTCTRLTFQTPAETVTELVLVACTAAGELLSADQADRLLRLEEVTPLVTAPSLGPPATLGAAVDAAAATMAAEARFEAMYQERAAQLEQWAEDRKLGLEAELKTIDRRIRDAQAEARQATTLADKLAGQQRVRELEQARATKRRRLFDEQDRVDEERNRLINDILTQLNQSVERVTVFTLYWEAC